VNWEISSELMKSARKVLPDEM